jgi:hypothetical protein
MSYKVTLPALISAALGREFYFIASLIIMVAFIFPQEAAATTWLFQK